MRAVAMNPESSRLSGIPVGRTLMVGWGLAALVGALAGALIAPRLFLDEASLEAGREVQATPAQAHYLGGVMRRGAGDPVLLFNGRDGEWSARIASISAGSAPGY